MGAAFISREAVVAHVVAAKRRGTLDFRRDYMYHLLTGIIETSMVEKALPEGRSGRCRPGSWGRMESGDAGGAVAARTSPSNGGIPSGTE